MLIPVIYLNGKQDMVKDYILADLIDQNQIARFKRRDGWIRLSSKKIRSTQCGVYFGPERRGTSLDEVGT